MFLNSIAVWSAVLKDRLYSTTKQEKSSSVFTNFWFKFTIAELAPKLFTVFAVVQHPHIPYGLRCPCVYWYHFLLHVQYWNRFYTQYKMQNLHLSEISKWIWICYTTNRWISNFFTVPILLGNNWKIGLGGVASRRCRYVAENLKIIGPLKV